MNTPIYDALVAELREQQTRTVPFRRAAVTTPAPPRPYDWFAPTTPAAPPGLQGIANIVARVSLATHQPNEPMLTGTGIGSCYTDSSAMSDVGACA